MLGVLLLLAFPFGIVLRALILEEAVLPFEREERTEEGAERGTVEEEERVEGRIGRELEELDFVKALVVEGREPIRGVTCQY